MSKIVVRHEKYPSLHKVSSYDHGHNIQNPKKKSTYKRNRTALTAYSDGVLVSKICEHAGFSKQKLYDLLDRHELMGRRGLILHEHSGQRDPSVDSLSSPTSKANQLGALWKRYPWLEYVLRQAVDTECLPASGRPGDEAEAVSKGPISDPALYGLFQEQLEIARAKEALLAGVTVHEPAGAEAENVEPTIDSRKEERDDDDEEDDGTPTEFPESSPNKGRKALKEWATKVREQREARRRYHEEQLREAREREFPEDGLGEFFLRCDTDGHKLDVNWMVKCISPNGTGAVEKIHVKRLWFIPIIEIRSGAILGYTYRLNGNYDAADMCRAMRNALTTWKKRALTLTTLAYRENDKLPSAYDSELAGLQWDELHLDNAKAHLARLFIRTVQHAAGCILKFGPRAAPNSRPKIEKIFHLLEAAGFHKIPATTGSNPDDPLGDAVTKRRYNLTLDVLLDILDLFVCRWNASSPSNNNISRLEILKQYVRRPNVLTRRLSSVMSKHLERFDVRDFSTIVKKGDRVIVRWANGEYEGSCLSKKASYLGQEVVVEAFSGDPREIQVSLLRTGEVLGSLRVDGRFSDTIHSLQSRSIAVAMSENNRFSTQVDDLVLEGRRASTAAYLKGDKRMAGAAALFTHEQLDAPAVAMNAPAQSPSVPQVASKAADRSPSKGHPRRPAPKPMEMPDEAERRLAGYGAAYQEK